MSSAHSPALITVRDIHRIASPGAISRPRKERRRAPCSRQANLCSFESHGVDMRAPLPLLVLAPLLAYAPAQAEFLVVPSPDLRSTDAAAPATPDPQTTNPRPWFPPRPSTSGFWPPDSSDVRGAPDRSSPFPGRLCRSGPKGRRGRLEGRRLMAGDPRQGRAPAWARHHSQRTKGDDRSRPSSLNRLFRRTPSLFAPSSLRPSSTRMESLLMIDPASLQNWIDPPNSDSTPALRRK